MTDQSFVTRWHSASAKQALRYGASLISALLLLSATAEAQGVTTDLWDVSRGTSVTSNSNMHSGFAAQDMLGAKDGNIEPGNTIFEDNQAQATVHWIEWETPAPVTIKRFRLFAEEDDSQSNQRSIEHVRLFAFINDNFEVFFDDDVASPYDYAGPRPLLRYQVITPVSAGRFRAEFTQYLPPGFSGPRITELDGFPNGDCADVNYDGSVTATDALVTLKSAVGTISCEDCVCDVVGRNGATSNDALRILQLAVGQLVSADCPPCAPALSTTTSTTMPPA